MFSKKTRIPIPTPPPTPFTYPPFPNVVSIEESSSPNVYPPPRRSDEVTVSTSSKSIVVDEFECKVKEARGKIDTYFSQLIDTLTNRRAELISDLNEILANHKLQQEKIKEMEKMNKQHKEMYSHSTVKELLDDLTVRVETELSSLKEKILLSVEFEWNQKYAKEASKLGKLIQSVSSPSEMSEDILVRLNTAQPAKGYFITHEDMIDATEELIMPSELRIS